jgi:hypothetical protein
MGRLGAMAPTDEVPEADRLEQEMPAAKTERDLHHIPPEAPDADVLEQELPLLDEGETAGIDAERTEPVSDDDWASTSSG